MNCWLKQMSEYGVITGASSDYFKCLKLMALSCNRQGVPLTVFDDGLLDDQIEYLLSMGVDVLAGTAGIVAERYKFNPNNPLIIYEKPFKCLKTPYKKTVWIDSDAIPLRDIGFFFDLLDKEEAFFTKDYYSGSSVSLELLELLKCPNLEMVDLGFNSGVFGWREPCEIIELWASVVHYVSTVPELRELPKCCDQDMLYYAVNALDKANLILEGTKYNTPANFQSDRSSERRKQYVNDKDLLENISMDHPESLVVHWMGIPKLDHLVF